MSESKAEAVNHPKHYKAHTSGVECIQIVEHMPFNIGSVIKYLWRAGQKDNEPSERDYNKAMWYLLREMQRTGVKLTVEQAHIDKTR